MQEAEPRIMSTTLIVATINEIDGLREIAPKINPKWVDQILLLDGGSTDGTVEFAQQMGWDVYRQIQKGLRCAYQEVWPLIEGDYVITFSPDGNSIPEMIPALIAEAAKGFDLVIASRYKDAAKSLDDDIITGFGNWIFTSTANKLFGGRLTDAMVIYRIYKKTLPLELDLMGSRRFELVEGLFRTHISWEPLLTVRALKLKKRVGEIAADEPPRIGGERKLQVVRWGAAFMTQFFLERFWWRD